MRHHLARTLGLSAAALLVVSSAASAQGKSQDKAVKHDKHVSKASKSVRTDDRRDDRRDDRVIIRDGRDVYGNGAKVPPGLAKKPGQMPPGQYKKRYGTNEGADVLGGIFRRRGYTVLRVVPAGDSRYVYYRLRDGGERRAIVSPGTDRLTFTNVPAALLREVLAQLY